MSFEKVGVFVHVLTMVRATPILAQVVLQRFSLGFKCCMNAILAMLTTTGKSRSMSIGP